MMTTSETSPDPEKLKERYRRARERRQPWEGHWRDCYEHALPQREAAIMDTAPGVRKGTRLYDGTATDAVDQLAASLLSELTPPWDQWFDFKPGREAPEEAHPQMSQILGNAAAVLQGHFDRSNFAVEMHQCYLDLVTAGTACLMFEEAPAGEPTAFRFTAVPLSEVVFEESLGGKLDTTFRRSELTVAQFRERYPEARLTESEGEETESNEKIAVIEAVYPARRGYEYVAIREGGEGEAAETQMLRTGTFRSSPFINFRWVKAPGEIYGRSPVMKALPDIKTANKVVELILKNASIAVTGIWQADDDGVLNPATIKLEPGTIIPKAVGSAGLTPLRPANDMTLSTDVLEQMRGRIRHALMIDMLGQSDRPDMTATEVLERSMEMARLLGATYGRLQSELLTPLAVRAVGILQRRGEIGRFEIDGRIVEMIYTSPLARHRRQREAGMVRDWITTVTAMGPEAQQLLNPLKASRYLAGAFGVPEDILRTEAELAEVPEDLPQVPGLGANGDILGAIGDALSGAVPIAGVTDTDTDEVVATETAHVQ
ncbi:MAG: head-tail connector protein [Rhodospirillales bacterium]|nr:head-tail connector protein [Rhodospirillales bacterium]MBO6787515.1 head-tail connector protein [Rhodospirillales bacterium]